MKVALLILAFLILLYCLYRNMEATKLMRFRNSLSFGDRVTVESESGDYIAYISYVDGDNVSVISSGKRIMVNINQIKPYE